MSNNHLRRKECFQRNNILPQQVVVEMNDSQFRFAYNGA